MQSLATKHDIPLRFFPAITPNRLNEVKNEYHPLRTKLWWGRPLIPTEQACCLSHIQVWRDFISSEHDYLLVFEDDLKIQDDFMKMLSALFKLNTLPDFIKLSGQHLRPNIKYQDINFKDAALYLYAYGPIDAAGYILSKKGAIKLEKYCKKMHMAIDIMMDRSFDHGIPIYCLKPFYVAPIVDLTGDLMSQIGDRINKYNHNNFLIKFITRILRLHSSNKKRLATLKIYMINCYKRLANTFSKQQLF